MSGKITFRGNCHCARFRFELDLSEVISATSCDCVACFKNGILWTFPAEGEYKITRDDGVLTSTQHGGTLYHKFCSKCSISVVGTHLSGPLKGRFGVNIRALLNVNPFAVEVKKLNHPDARVQAIDSSVNADGLKTYHGSCTCGALALDFRTKPLPELAESDIKEDNCSICVRTAGIGVYPKLSQVTIGSSSVANASTYAWGLKYSGMCFCKDCGVQVWSDLRGPPADLVATWSEARQQMVKRKLDLKPLNVRALEGVEWDHINIQRSDEGTEGYVVD